jgi:hypothetical protein
MQQTLSFPGAAGGVKSDMVRSVIQPILVDRAKTEISEALGDLSIGYSNPGFGRKPAVPGVSRTPLDVMQQVVMHITDTFFGNGPANCRAALSMTVVLP